MESQSPWISAFAGMTIKGRVPLANQQGLAMSDFMRLPETLGAAPKPLSAANYAHAAEALSLDDTVRGASLSRDAEGSNRLLAGHAAMRCFVVMPD